MKQKIRNKRKLLTPKTILRQTTERYLGCTQRISSAVNDRIGIEPKP